MANTRFSTMESNRKPTLRASTASRRPTPTRDQDASVINSETTSPSPRPRVSRPNGASPATRFSGGQAIDEQLLADINAGDRSAYAAFYDRHASRILGVLIRALRHRADAEDVLQDTFHQVWRSAHQYSAERSSPEVWLMLLARSRLLDFVRRRRPDATGSLVQTEARPIDPLAELVRVESAQRVRVALDKLPEEQRSAIALSYFNGLTHQQIAEFQSIPLGTAKTRILLGIRALRKSLQGLRETSS